MSPRTAKLAAALALALALAGTSAHAEDAIVKGAIVKIELREIYVNLGAGQGVAGGSPIRIKRPIKLQHPVTRAAIEDWLPVGSATVTQAGAALSRAVVGDLVTAIRVGDVAEVLITRPDARPPAPPQQPAPAPAPPPPPQPPVDPVTREVLAVFAAQAGQSIDARIAGWERYLSTNPGSPHATAIRADLETLQALREQLGPASAGRTGASIEPLEHSVPAPTAAGQALPVVFVLARPEQVASAYLHFRSGSRRTYQRALLAREHEIYLRGTVPAELVGAPGIEYFVEVSTPSGDAGLALGSPEMPVRVAVKPPPFTQRFGDQPGRTTVRVAGEHLDFATFDHRRGDRTDQMTIGTIDVSYELGTTVQRVGVGAGAIIGAGGYRDSAWGMDATLPRTGFNYGRADVELGRPTLAAGISGIAGVGKAGLGLGIEGRVRIGARRGTNLQLLAQSLPELGWFADTRLGVRPARDLLLGISVGATDQPNTGDVGAKLGAELEWLGIPGAILRVRGSWQGRSVAHGGIGGGAAVELTW